MIKNKDSRDAYCKYKMLQDFIDMRQECMNGVKEKIQSVIHTYKMCLTDFTSAYKLLTFKN